MVLQAHDGVTIHDVCLWKKTTTLQELEALLMEIKTHVSVVFYICNERGEPPYATADISIIQNSLDALHNDAQIQCSRIYYDSLEKKYMPDIPAYFTYIEKDNPILNRIRFNRKQLEVAGIIELSPQYTYDENLKGISLTWNGIIYTTFAQIKAVHELDDYRAITLIDGRLERGRFHAYKKVENDEITKSRIKELPHTGPFWRHGKNDYARSYAEADGFMFFERELQAHELVLSTPHEDKAQTPPPSEQQETPPQAWDKALQVASNVNPEKHRKLYAYYLRYWQLKSIKEILQILGTSSRKIERLINEGRDIAKTEQLFLPENDEKRE